MPRGPRLDAPGALHHVIVRGIERRNIFRSDGDRADFVQRLERVWERTGLNVLAWALLPNHVHLLVRSGFRPLAASMRQLLTGYAISFNLRHRRIGHLFQNRYKSILVEEDPYLLELVRYIHLNPLRACIVKDVGALERFRWTGHSVILGRMSRPWQATGEVLGRFGGRLSTARQAYRSFVRNGAKNGHRPDLQGGGLRRSMGGWENVAVLGRGRELWTADERILGGPDFVLGVLKEAEQTSRQGHSEAKPSLNEVIERVAKDLGLSVKECCGGGRRRLLVRARAVISHKAVRELGFPVVSVARALGVSSQAILMGLERVERRGEPGGGRTLRRTSATGG